jgi:3',5'-cyclic AMP phosphodiesterase CpdA
MKIAQISDSHISMAQPSRTRDLQATIESVNAAGPDLVVHTGDIAHDGLSDEYNTARELLAALQAPLLPMVGNRDHRQTMTRAFADNPYFDDDSPFVQYCVDFQPLRVIVLDTLHESSNKGQLCEQRMQHFEQMLTDAQGRVAIFMHHPPFAAHEIPEPQQFEDWSQVQAFAKLVSAHASVQGIWCGHVHRNIDSTVGHIQARALTCMACDLRKGEMTEEQQTRVEARLIEL